MEDGLTGPIGRFFETENVETLLTLTGAEAGDLVMFVADKPNVVAQSLGALRVKLAKELGLIDETKLNFLWVTDWPLLEYDEDAKRYVAAHHPFTSPKEADIAKLGTAPEEAEANAYDIVLNGYELGSGAIRISDPKLQKEVMLSLGLSEKAINEKFGFLLEAYQYGAPVHGGIGLGLDRIMMLLEKTQNIREVIAFPKNTHGFDLMMETPSAVVDEDFLKELSIKILD